MPKSRPISAAGGVLIAALSAARSAAAQTDGRTIMTVFRFQDRNGDGFVDRGEFRRARAARFDRMDANRDGKVTVTEFSQQRAGDRRRLAVLTTSPKSAPEMLEAAAEQAYRELDRDGDGAVTRAEFMEAGEARFAQTDRDGDGRISRDEWARAAAAGGQRAR